MWNITRRLTVAILLGLTLPAWAAAPDLLPPVSMQVDPGSSVIAQGLDFIDAPLSGAINFSPQNYDVHLGGNIVIPVQDVIPYFSVQQPLKDCQGVASNIVEKMMFYINTLTQYIFPKVLGAPVPKNVPDSTKFFNEFMVQCNNNPQLIDALMTQGALPRQIVADVRNSGAGATDVVFSGQMVDPVADFSSVPKGYAGVVIGGGSAANKDVWSDGIVVAGYEDAGFSKTFATPLMSSSLYLYRFLPNAAQKKVLQFAGLSTAWLDKPVQTNGKVTNPCFKGDPNDKLNPVTMKTPAELLADGCVGESSPVGIVAFNLFGHANDKLKDLVVLSRAPMGDPKDPASKIGFLTFYKRTDKIPDDTSMFQDIWQFDKSLTNASNGGMPEPYGIATIKSWDAKAGKFIEGVVVGSNKLHGVSRYYVYYYTHDGIMKEPLAILVGGVSNPALPGFGGFGPYRVYSADVNDDRCGDILITRAKISPDGKKIEFADYFDVHLQNKTPNAECRQTFQKDGTKYSVPPVDPKTPVQISSLAITDFNKDGLIDVMAGDFTTYLDAKAPQTRVNYVHFLENVSGLFNTIQPPRYIVNTKTHGDDVGVIDVKADAFANLGAVTGKAVTFEEVNIPPVVLVSKSACDEGLVAAQHASLCKCGRDLDLDGTFDLNVDKNFFPNGLGKIQVALDCSNKDANGNPIFVELDLTSKVPVKYTDCQGVSVTNIPRKLLMDWTHCDNCNALSADVCTGPEKSNNCKDPVGQVIPCADKCANPGQIDIDADGYGDFCDQFPNDNTQSRLPSKVIPVAKARKQIREDRVVYASDTPAIAYKEQLKLTGLPVENGHEVTVLLNKAKIKDTDPPKCQGSDLDCICLKNPDLQACKCLKDPNAAGCKEGPMPQIACCLDVCRGDLTASFPEMCDYIRPYNDEIRKITGLCMDVLVPVEGTQYHLSCTIPNAPAMELGGGKAYAQVFKTTGSQIPKNYFKDWHKPVASQNLLKNNVLLNPPDEAVLGGVVFDVNKLPKPDFPFDASLSAVAPDISVNQAPGITQVDGIMQIETYVTDLDPATGAPVLKQAATLDAAVPPVVAKSLLLDIKGYSSPAGCQWAGADCPEVMPNPPSPQAFVDAITAKVAEAKAAGKTITIDTINDAFKAMDVGPAFMHQQFVVAGSQSAMTVPIQNVMPGSYAEGGCGCTFNAASSMQNTLLPLLMAVSALGGMFLLRRKSAKKH